MGANLETVINIYEVGNIRVDSIRDHDIDFVSNAKMSKSNLRITKAATKGNLMTKSLPFRENNIAK